MTLDQLPFCQTWITPLEVEAPIVEGLFVQITAVVLI